MNGTRFHLTALAAVSTLGLLAAGDARAGDRPLVMRFVNMTPDAASTDEASKCAAHLRDRAAQESVDLKAITETPLRKLISATDKSVSFMTWSRAQTESAWKDVDVFLAIDCRPEQRRLDALVLNKTGARIELRVRGEKLDRPRAVWVMDEVLSQAWAGFEL